VPDTLPLQPAAPPSRNSASPGPPLPPQQLPGADLADVLAELRAIRAALQAQNGPPALFLRAAQAAAFCGVSEATWWRWDSAGRIPAGRKISGGVKVWNRPELERWAEAGCPSRAEWEARRGRP